MAYADFDGREIVKALRSKRYEPVTERAATSNSATSIRTPTRSESSRCR